MYKFGQIEVASKDFHSTYEVNDTVDLGKIRVSKGVVANKHDTWYTIGYEVEPGKIIPLHMKTPKNCHLFFQQRSSVKGGKRFSFLQLGLEIDLLRMLSRNCIVSF